MSKVVQTKIMPVSMDTLLGVITDFERYPEFLPEVVGARTVSSGNGKATVRFELDLIKRFNYILDFDLSGGNSVSWTLASSDFFKVNTGRWSLEPEGTATKATYELEVNVGFFVPSFVARTLTEVNLPKVLSQFEARALELASTGKKPKAKPSAEKKGDGKRGRT